ncbi:MAG: UDP-glucose 4-epimerase GalE [Clostridia bacterium]|nr:UDP-glucose 4-epimerase GalE [Clostridia bacterium]
MNVLITGGAGYIGSHTCVELLNAGHAAIVVDNLANSSAAALKRVERIAGKEVAFYEGDVRDEALLDRVFDERDIDCAIHFAGLKCVPESVSKPMEYYDNNINSTLTLCRVMARRGVKRLVFSSSATVYSAQNAMPLSENSVTGDCTNPYGWTKYISERLLTDIAAADGEWSIALLRYFNPIGAHESGLIGEDPRGIPNNLMPYISQTAVGRRDELTVYGSDYDTKDGTGVRDYIHVMDLAKGHVAAIGYLLEHRGAAAFNLGTGKGVSVLEMVEAFQRANEVAVPFRFGPRRPGDVATCYADASRSEKLLHWRAEKTLEDMCRDSWHWQRLNPQGYGE